MKRQSIMDTYKEIKAAYNSTCYVATQEDKAYWVGTDENGIIKCTLCIQDITGLSNLRDIVATNSDQAKARYAGMMAEDAEGQKYFESFHP